MLSLISNSYYYLKRGSELQRIRNDSKTNQLGQKRADNNYYKMNHKIINNICNEEGPTVY